ncbi:MAG: MarR family transcriptional regulator [Solirubrobacteraceae bacterium]
MPAPAEPPRPSTALANELRPILVRLARELRKETSHLGITGGQATLLWQVAENPGIGLRALAELEGIATPTVSGLIDRLQRAGLVTRERSQTDRRRIGLTITPAGSELLVAVRARRTVWLADRLERLQPAARAAIAAALDPLHGLIAERKP